MAAEGQAFHATGPSAPKGGVGEAATRLAQAKVPRTGLHTLIAGGVCLAGFTGVYMTILSRHKARLSSEDPRRVPHHEYVYRKVSTNPAAQANDADNAFTTLSKSASSSFEQHNLRPIVRERDNHHYTVDQVRNGLPFARKEESVTPVQMEQQVEEELSEVKASVIIPNLFGLGFGGQGTGEEVDAPSAASEGDALSTSPNLAEQVLASSGTQERSGSMRARIEQPAPQRGVDGIAYTKAPAFRSYAAHPRKEEREKIVAVRMRANTGETHEQAEARKARRDATV